jgi:hypothetical protein
MNNLKNDGNILVKILNSKTYSKFHFLLMSYLGFKKLDKFVVIEIVLFKMKSSIMENLWNINF